MLESTNKLGAIAAHVVFISSIATFGARMLFNLRPGHWVGIPLLLMVFPLGYLLLVAPGLKRPVLYYIQIGLMLAFIVLLFLVDYVWKFDFRQTQWMVISFVIFYFAAIGGMLGVTSLAGRGWMISGIILFFAAAILAFVQRAVTGL